MRWLFLFMGILGRKDAFPGADGSTIGSTLQTMLIYDSNNTPLTDGSTGVKLVDITTEDVLNENIAQVYAHKNPLTFIYNVDNLGDWYTNNFSFQDNMLWGDKDKKSVFDPCPAGWQVPTDSEKTFGDFSTTTMTLSGWGMNVSNGRTYSNTSWFPATGYRNRTSGTLYSVGSNGYYWSVSVSGTNAKYMYFSMSEVIPTRTNGRGYGFSVRCIQE
ncbi:MAG TPA: fibrobacter succinogenes major paralogous domain-containing protein [Candidatus Rikenella faecigallinarum]|uniref:Fibrobacter succinogenes major paralogous domain-containing protein n=1 Tax=Candidatus Rikenella faecigallinarum TaxID=2838745 RepID=A0A9D1QDX3_9BACT|nr:fibrobacter succinogenes major paralogous domain-containing protein [Candidatus Rikenella faecigallinarum]